MAVSIRSPLHHPLIIGVAFPAEAESQQTIQCQMIRSHPLQLKFVPPNEFRQASSQLLRLQPLQQQSEASCSVPSVRDPVAERQTVCVERSVLVEVASADTEPKDSNRAGANTYKQSQNTSIETGPLGRQRCKDLTGVRVGVGLSKFGVIGRSGAGGDGYHNAGGEETV